MGQISIREVRDEDLEVFYKQQRDPEAIAMAAVAGRERQAFFSHWAKIRADPANVLRTVVEEDHVAGNVVSWPQSGQYLVGYWLGRSYWGRGIATRALELFLPLIPSRPVYAHVVVHNTGSIRVLEKSGFQRAATPVTEPAVPDGVEEIQFVLD